LALFIALLSSVCFAVGMVTSRVGLRTLDARSGAALSIPTATVLFVLATPFALDTSGFDLRAVLFFAAVGLIFPVSVTLLTFRSNELLGPTVTSAISGTAPLFALLTASLFLGEQVPPQATVSALGVVAGVALLSWKKGAVSSGFIGWVLLWPLAGAVMRGVAQTGAKAGLLLWSNAFAAGLAGYLVSCAVVVLASRSRGPLRPKPTRRDIAWFAVTGVLNGGGVLLMYFALSMAPVWVVAPIIASYPLLTAIISTAVLHDDKLTLHAAAGGGLTIAAIVYLIVSQAP
jgi:drug/metabolite transporter (DMT)-like permease